MRTPTLTRRMVHLVTRAAAYAGPAGEPPPHVSGSDGLVFVTPRTHPSTPAHPVPPSLPKPLAPPLIGPGRRRVPDEELKALGIKLPAVMRKIAEVRGKSGKRYFVCGTLSAGTYGKFMYGVDELGNEFAFKVLRRQDKDAPPKTDAKGNVVGRTRTITVEKADKEVANTKKYSTLLRVEDELDVNGSRYVRMRPMACALDVALKDVKNWSTRRVAVRYMLVNVSNEVAEMHRRGGMHTDLKAPNVLVDAYGRLAVCDFGSVLDLLHDDPDAPVCADLKSSYPPPESPYGSAADVWSLGATIACLYAGNKIHLFGWDQIPLRMEAFKEFRKAVLKDDGTVDLTAVPETNAWRQFFTDFATHDNQLCAFVLREMLNPLPEGRASMAAVRLRVRTVVSEKDLVDGRKVLSSLAQQRPYRKIFKTLNVYRVKRLEQEACAAHRRSSTVPTPPAPPKAPGPFVVGGRSLTLPIF